jgi:hypothetical protein
MGWVPAFPHLKIEMWGAPKGMLGLTVKSRQLFAENGVIPGNWLGAGTV